MENMDRYSDFILAQRGDIGVRNSLVEQNMKLVHHVGKRYRTYQDYEDISQSGVIGLIYAVDHFDVSKGYSFSTYAGMCILGYMKHYLNDSRKLRLGHGYTKLFYKLQRELTKQRENSGFIDHEKAMRNTGMSSYEYAHLNLFLRPLVCIDGPPNGDPENKTFAEIIPDENGDDEFYLMLKLMLEQLDPIVRSVFEKSYFHGETIANISSQLKISSFEVRKHKKRAIAKIKQWDLFT